MKAKFMFMVFVPRESRKGVPFTVAHHQKWDKFVYDLSGGITILKSALGKWVNPNAKLEAEKMIPVMVGCTKAQMENIADFTVKHYDQVAVSYVKMGKFFLVYAD